MDKTVDQIIEEAGETPVNTEQKTDFLSDVPKKTFETIDDLVEKLATEEKQDYTAKFTDEPPKIEEETTEDYSEEPGSDFEGDFFDESESSEKENAKKNASNITRWSDNVIAFVLGWFSGEMDNFTIFKADKSSLKIIEESLYQAFNSFKEDFVIPWWSGLTLEVPIAYFPKIQLALRLRKKNKNKKNAEKEKTEQTAKNHDSIIRADVPKSNKNTSMDKDVVSDVEFEDIPLVKTCKLCEKKLLKGQKTFCNNACKTSWLKVNNRKTI